MRFIFTKIPRRLALALLLSSPVLAVELTFSGISVPETDAAGHLLRRLTAESGTGWPGEKSKLKNGLVEFFAVATVPPERIATLVFSDATFDPAQRIITGNGHVVLHSPRGDLAGDGFEYDLPRNRLWLKSAVTFDLNEVHVTGGEGEAFLAQAPTSQGALIVSATVKSGVVVTGIANPKFDVEEAGTDSAVYTAADETITLASPVNARAKGKTSGTTFNEMKINVGGKRKPAGSPDAASPAAPAAVQKPR